jgi:riboflavin biosynthesis pyrimidine reductase
VSDEGVKDFDCAPLELLFEPADLPRFDLPAALVRAYGGGLGFDSPCLFANFVASLDGVVALSGSGESGHVVSQGSAADRFVMGLLRACADAVLVGAGTFRAAAGELWLPDAIFPGAADEFAETRRRLGLRAQPKLVLVTRSGQIDPDQPALHGALIATTRTGEAVLRSRVPSDARVVVIGSDSLRLRDVLALLRAEGASRVLTEGGPTLFAELLCEELVDELFVTRSPVLFGRYRNDLRKSLADGLDLGGTALELAGVRRHASHLFLRYSRTRAGA